RAARRGAPPGRPAGVSAGHREQHGRDHALRAVRLRDRVRLLVPWPDGASMTREIPLPLAVRVGNVMQAQGRLLATAESCTGGLIAGAITDVAGSSGRFDRGLVTYSNEANSEMPGVRPDTLASTGA